MFYVVTWWCHDHSSIGITIEMSELFAQAVSNCLNMHFQTRFSHLLCRSPQSAGPLQAVERPQIRSRNGLRQRIGPWCSELVVSRQSSRKIIQRCKTCSRHAPVTVSCNLLCCAFLRTSRSSWPLLPSFWRGICAPPRGPISSLTRPFIHWLVSRTRTTVRTWIGRPLLGTGGFCPSIAWIASMTTRRPGCRGTQGGGGRWCGWHGRIAPHAVWWRGWGWVRNELSPMCTAFTAALIYCVLHITPFGGIQQGCSGPGCYIAGSKQSVILHPFVVYTTGQTWTPLDI